LLDALAAHEPGPREDSLRIVAEPGGAASLAALLEGGYAPGRDERVGILISGGNTTAVNFG
jgi:threonine dehydratase